MHPHYIVGVRMMSTIILNENGNFAGECTLFTKQDHVNPALTTLTSVSKASDLYSTQMHLWIYSTLLTL